MGNPKGLTESGSGELGIIVCGRIPWLYQYWRVGLCFFWFFVQELLEAQQAVVLVLKRLRRRGKWLEVFSDRLGELGFFFFFFLKLFVAFPWVKTSTVPRGFMICVFINRK